MLCNIHTHTNFCDGENSPEEIVLAAIEKGFSSIGFSGHSFTNFGEPFGIRNIESYIKTITDLKIKYKSEIQIYLGIEDDALSPINNRNDFDYIIGSNHYVKLDNKIYPVDLDDDTFKKMFSAFENAENLAENYYGSLCNYLLKFKPQVIGHYDLITKFDEKNSNFLVNNVTYNKVAEKYLKIALGCEGIFEVNTGAVSRGYRTTPYPSENLLYIIKKSGGKVMLSSDAHCCENLDFGFDDAKKLLKYIGFQYIYVLYNNEFKKQEL